MKVLWVFNHPAPYKINFFNELGKKVDLTALFERTSEGDRCPSFYYEKAKNFQALILKSTPFGDVNNYSSRLVKEVRSRSYDVLVVNGWSTFSEMALIRYLKRHKIPYVFAINGGIAKKKESPLRRHLKRRYLPGAALYLSPDEHSSSYLSFYGVDPSKIVIYPYSTIFASQILSAPLNESERNRLRQEEHRPLDHRLFVSVGSFIERKNNKELLDVWEKAPKDCDLLLIGNGPQEKEYETIIETNHLSNVTILPYKSHDDVLRYFRMADASLFLTKEDIYGHVVNECLSQGTPVIASKHANSALKLIHDGANGFLVDIADESEILSAIQKPVTPAMRENALATAQANTIELSAAAHEEIFRRFLGK